MSKDNSRCAAGRVQPSTERPDSVQLGIAPGDTALDLDGDELRDLFLQARGLAEGGDLASALEYYRRGLLRRPLDARFLRGAAYCHLGLGQQQDAVEVLETQRKHDPSDAWSFKTLAEAYLQVGRLSEAIECGRRAAALNPKSGFAYRSLGTALLSAGRIHEGEAAIDASLALEPESLVGLYAKGRVYEARGQYKRAIEIFARVLLADPMIKGARVALAHAQLNLGMAERAAGNKHGRIAVLDAAYRALEAEHNLNPANAEVLMYYAMAAFGALDIKRAIVLLSKYQELVPGDPDGARYLGNAYFQDSDFASALPAYLKALSLNPRGPHSRQNVAVCYLRLNQWGKAIYHAILGLLHM